MKRPAVGIFGLTGCAGDQLAILNLESRLLDIVTLLDVRDFLTASSANDTACSLDVAFVEGSVSTRRDEEALRTIRRRATTIVALGTCAVWGGPASMDRGADRPALLRQVYGDAGETYDSQSARALHEVVQVDLNITGCPVEPVEVLQAIGNLLNGDRPAFPEYPVCAECRMAENNCLLIDLGEPCCGPNTVAGCNARCPGLRIPCIGCRGPFADANTQSLLETLEAGGPARERMAARLRIFAPDGGAK